MSEWQPIETAPKDGTILVLFCGRDIDRTYASPNEAARYCLGFYGDGGGMYQTGTWYTVESRTEIWGYGSEMTGPMTETECLTCEPTHWFPLPNPPNQSPDGSEP